MDSELVMYLVVNDSLNMSPGKIAAQVGHAVDMLCEAYQDLEQSIRLEYYILATDMTLFDEFSNWRKQSRAKIVLKANEKEWEELRPIAKVEVQDEGRTEIAPGSITVLGFWPMAKLEAPNVIKFLKKY